MRRAIAGGAVVALLVTGGLGLATVKSGDQEAGAPPSAGGQPRPAASPTVVSMAGYPLPQDLESAIEFQSTYMFEAVVTGPSLPARKIEANPETGAPLLVYVPVPVRVIAVYRGNLRPGDQVFLRALGGKAADGTTLRYENGWPDDTRTPGAKLFIFNQDSVELAGRPAITPNMVFVDDNGIAKSALGRNLPKMPIQRMREKVIARWQ